MYEIIKSVIQSKDYELREMLYKINKMYIESAITEEQKAELDELARQNAVAENSYAPLKVQHVGDKIIYNGKKYICKLDNCVWSPDEYPSAWEEVSEG